MYLLYIIYTLFFRVICLFQSSYFSLLGCSGMQGDEQAASHLCEGDYNLGLCAALKTYSGPEDLSTVMPAQGCSDPSSVRVVQSDAG